MDGRLKSCTTLPGVSHFPGQPRPAPVAAPLEAEAVAAEAEGAVEAAPLEQRRQQAVLAGGLPQPCRT